MNQEKVCEVSKSKRKITDNFNVLKFCFFQVILNVGIYLMGLFNISPAWLLFPLFISAARERWMVEKQLKHYMITSKFQKRIRGISYESKKKFPPWVYNQDVDCCEFLNKIVLHIWPYCGNFACNVVKDKLEPKISEALQLYRFSGFEFEILRLGSVSPRISAVKVYEKNNNQNEIAVDLNIVYVGNCDISFSLYGISGGIQDFQMNGWLRLTMKPLLFTSPIVAGMEMCFLEQPKVEFNFVGAINVLDIPGVSGIIRKVIDDQIESIMVLPNKIDLLWSDDGSQCKFFEPEAIVRVHVIEAFNLVPIEQMRLLGSVEVSPHVTVSIGFEIMKSDTVENTSNPRWNFLAEFIVDNLYNEAITISVYKGSNCIGVATIDGDFLKKEHLFDMWVQLQDINKGMLHLCMYYLHLTSVREDIMSHFGTPPSLATSLLMIVIDSADNLSHPDLKSEPTIFAKISVDNNTDTSNKALPSNNPKFNQSFRLLVKDPELSVLEIDLVDDISKLPMGKFIFQLKNILSVTGMEILNNTLPLMNANNNSTITISMRLRALKLV